MTDFVQNFNYVEHVIAEMAALYKTNKNNV